MDYRLHITRRIDWADYEGASISFEDWFAVVTADPEMVLSRSSALQVADGGRFRSDDPTAAVWMAYSRHGKDNAIACFVLLHGNVDIKNPDREVKRKMWRLAQVLKARVQGEDGEFYDCFGHPTRNAFAARNYWLALCRHIGFMLMWRDPVRN